MSDLARYFLCLTIAVLCICTISSVAVDSPDRFGYAAAGFVACVISMGVAAASIVLAW